MLVVSLFFILSVFMKIDFNTPLILWTSHSKVCRRTTRTHVHPRQRPPGPTYTSRQRPPETTYAPDRDYQDPLTPTTEKETTRTHLHPTQRLPGLTYTHRQWKRSPGPTLYHRDRDNQNVLYITRIQVIRTHVTQIGDVWVVDEIIFRSSLRQVVHSFLVSTSIVSTPTYTISFSLVLETGSDTTVSSFSTYIRCLVRSWQSWGLDLYICCYGYLEILFYDSSFGFIVLKITSDFGDTWVFGLCVWSC